MNLKAFLLFSLLLLVWILASKVYMLLYYWSALMICVSFLNTCKQFKEQPYRWINLVFFLYILFIVWERTRHYKFSEITELVINDAEHIFFALVISLLIVSTLTAVFGSARPYIKTIVVTILIFNLLGIVNELFQNLIAHRPVLVLIPDSKKDLLMNVCGTIIFILFAALLKPRATLLRARAAGK